MGPNQIFVTAILGIILSSCVSTPVDNTNESSLPGTEQRGLVILKTASLILESDTTTLQAGQRAVLTIRVSNPTQTTIDSVRSWLSFDPQKIKVVSIDDSTSDFDLTLSDEKKIDETKGVISIGRSTSKPLTGSQLEVVKIVLTPQPFTVEMSTPISLFDYQEGTQGHTLIGHVEQEHPYNIMQETVDDTIFITLQPLKIKR